VLGGFTEALGDLSTGHLRRVSMRREAMKRSRSFRRYSLQRTRRRRTPWIDVRGEARRIEELQTDLGPELAFALGLKQTVPLTGQHLFD
jgi:hypothetical protein